MIEKEHNKLFDSFMEFLRSDLWQIPVSQFIEQRSIVFEREPDLGSSPNTIESLQSVHNEFTKMVSDLVNAYCADCNQNREGVMEALKTAHREKFQQLSNKDKMLLEPIVASEHFDVFVPMMMRKNIELQLQALRMIEQHMKGLLPSSLLLGEEDAKLWEALDAEEQDESEKLILLAVLRQSKEEWENDQRMRADSEGQMERALRESLSGKAHLEEMRRKEQLLLEKALSEKFSTISLGNEMKETTKNLKLNLPPNIVLKNSNTTINEENNMNFSEDIIVNESIKVIENERGISPVGDKPGTSQSLDPMSSRRSPDPRSGRSSQLSLPSNGEKIRVVRSASSKQETKRSDETDNNVNDKPSKNNENNKKSSENVNKKRRSLGQVHQPSRGKDNNKAGDSNKNSDLAYRSLLKKRDNIPDENIQSRMRYLREQRDKLLQKKSMERQKQLLATTDNSRPKTAQAARGLMAQKDSSELEERRRIAAKIKAEVIDKHQPQPIGQT